MRPEKKSNPTRPPKKNWRFFFKQKKTHGVSPGVSVSLPQDGVRPIQVTQAFRPEKRAWTGVVTSVAVEMLQQQLVDAVLCVGSVSPERPLEPRPILARSVEEVLECGGVKPMLSPNLLPLEELWQASKKCFDEKGWGGGFVESFKNWWGEGVLCCFFC